jgi:serine/threonine protein kinase
VRRVVAPAFGTKNFGVADQFVDRTMNATAPLKFGKYWLTDRIAVGGMAELYRGKISGEEGFEKAVAVKKILPHLSEEQEAVSYFIDEARLAALLQHPNIVQIYDFGRLDDSYFIAMEYLFGKDLKTVLHTADQRGMPLSLENALHIAVSVCSGLDYAHNMKDLQGHLLNIIHRDVSPQNIFLTYDGQIKIIDFGIAKAASRISNTRSGVIKGKVAYMSPEQAEGNEVDHRSDIFSVGILLYEMVTGRYMYEGDAMDILSQAREARFTRAERIVRDLPECLVAVLDMALAKHPDDRYDSCGEMLSDLEDCIYHLNFRPNGQKLSQFMKGLFDTELKSEEISMAWALRRVEPKPAINGSDDAGPINYQETVILTPEATAFAKKPLKKRWVMPLILLMLMAAALGFFYFRQAPPEDRSVVVRVPIASDHKGIPAPSTPGSDTAAAIDNRTRTDAPATPVDPQIAQWLQDARQNLEAWNLTEPKGRNAYYFYKEVLKRDPQNPVARQGIEDVAERYAQLAEREMKRSRNQKALDYIATGLSVDAENRRLWSLKEQIKRQVEQERQGKIQRLLVQANDCLNAYKLTRPTEDNALYYFRQVEKLDPGNKEARRGREKIADRYALLAEKEMNGFDYENARRYIATGLDIDPDNKKLLELKTEVNKRLDQRVLRSIKNLFD